MWSGEAPLPRGFALFGSLGGTSPQTGFDCSGPVYAPIEARVCGGTAPSEGAAADDVYRSDVLATRGFRQSISEGGHNR